MPAAFVKFREPVYEGNEPFSFDTVDYEIKDRDLKFLSLANLDISHTDFEKVIDVFEKIVARDANQSLQHLMTKFYEKVSKEQTQRINKSMLEVIY